VIVALVVLLGVYCVALALVLWLLVSVQRRDRPGKGTDPEPTETHERHVTRDEMVAAVGELVEDEGVQASVVAIDYWLRRSRGAHARKPGGGGASGVRSGPHP
jgi:hypothetical protein